MSTIKLQLKAKHFIDTEYNDCRPCAIDNAAKELFPDATLIMESVNYLQLDKVIYDHEYYGLHKFNIDKEKALLSDPETVIRTIELIPVN